MHRCAHVICLWSREIERERSVRGESAEGSLDAALTGLESDLSYLEELPAESIASSGGDLDGMSERLTRVIAALKDTAA